MRIKYQKWCSCYDGEGSSVSFAKLPVFANAGTDKVSIDDAIVTDKSCVAKHAAKIFGTTTITTTAAPTSTSSTDKDVAKSTDTTGNADTDTAKEAEKGTATTTTEKDSNGAGTAASKETPTTTKTNSASEAKKVIVKQTVTAKMQIPDAVAGSADIGKALMENVKFVASVKGGLLVSVNKGKAANAQIAESELKVTGIFIAGERKRRILRRNLVSEENVNDRSGIQNSDSKINRSLAAEKELDFDYEITAKNMEAFTTATEFHTQTDFKDTFKTSVTAEIAKDVTLASDFQVLEVKKVVENGFSYDLPEENKDEIQQKTPQDPNENSGACGFEGVWRLTLVGVFSLWIVVGI